jgi:hypothetical protein
MSEQRKEDHGLAEFINIRIARELKFLEYLASFDDQEILESEKQGGPYKERLSGVIGKQIRREIEVIRARTGARDDTTTK